MRFMIFLIAIIFAFPALGQQLQPISSYTGPIATSSITVGDGTNEVVIDETAVNLSATATVWDDIQGSLFGRRLESTAGKVNYNYAENTITMQSGGNIATTNDRVAWNIQMYHAAKADSDLECHIHWEQVDATDREFTVKSRIQNNGDAKNATWTTTVVASSTTTNLFTYSAGTLNQITELITIDLTGVGVSGILEFQLARTDAVAGDIEATFVDCHYEKDQLGSASEYTK